MVTKISHWQMPTQVAPVSTPEATDLQVHRLYMVQPITCVGRHFKNMFRTALTKVFLHFAGFLEVMTFFLRTTEFLMEVSTTCYEDVYF